MDKWKIKDAASELPTLQIENNEEKVTANVSKVTTENIGNVNTPTSKSTRLQNLRVKDVCPVCHKAFHNSATPLQVERHVHSHFIKKEPYEQPDDCDIF